MKLSQVVAAYVAHRQAMGMRFHTEARTLRSFCRASRDVTMQEIRPTACLPSLLEPVRSALLGAQAFRAQRSLQVRHRPGLCRSFTPAPDSSPATASPRGRAPSG